MLAFKPVTVYGIVRAKGEYTAHRGFPFSLQADAGATYGPVASCKELDAYLTEGERYRIVFNPATLRVYGAWRLSDTASPETTQEPVECGDALTRSVFVVAYGVAAVSLLAISLVLLLNLLHGGPRF